MRSRMIRLATLAGAALAVAASSTHAGSVWHNDWLSSAPMTLDGFEHNHGPGKPSVAVAFATDHDRVIAAPSSQSYEYQVMRMAADGALRWSASINDFAADSRVYAIRAVDDGGALVALGYPGSETYDDVILRFDAGGGFLWWRTLPSGWLARVSPSRTASAGCSRLTVFDDADGNVVWQRMLGSNAGSCTAGGLAADAQGNLYASTQSRQHYEISGYRIIAFDQDGVERWQIGIADAGGGDIAGLVGSLLYVRGTSELHALRIADGSLAWSAPVTSQARILFTQDAAQEALAIDGGMIRRLAADTGVPRWSTPLAGVDTADVIDGALLLATASSRVRVDTADGALVWAIADKGDPIRWLAFGDLGAGVFHGIGQPRAPGAGAAPVFDHGIDFANGQIVASIAVPSVAQGIAAQSRLDADGDVVDAGVTQRADFPQLHLRRVDTASGATLWERAESIDELGPGFHFRFPGAQASTSGEHIAATSPLSGSSACTDAGWARVASYDLADGARNWVVLLRDPDQLCTLVSAPALDLAGNVFVSVSSIVPCKDGTIAGCQRRTLYKLAAADGVAQWRVDEELDAGIEGLVATPKPLYVFGADVVVPGSFVGATANARRYAGADGSIVWSSQEFAGPSLYFSERIDVLGEHHLILHGYDYMTGHVAWAKVDADSGATLWSSEAPGLPPCEPYSACLLDGDSPLVLPDGDVLDAYQRDFAPWLQRWHNDGSGTLERWPVAPGSATTTSALTYLLQDEHAIRAVLLRRHRHAFGGSMSLLAGIDPATGTLTGQQALYGYGRDPLEDSSFPRALAMRPGERMLARTETFHAPQPKTHGVALLDTTVTAHGNLSIEAETDADRVSPGDVVAFHLQVRHEGDLPIEGARVLAHLPWSGGVRNVVCTTLSAANCQLDLRSGQVHARFDSTPGGLVDIRGEIEVFAAAEVLVFTAMVTGPIGLSEEDSLDNFDEVAIRQSLFRNGFEEGR